MSAIPAAMPPLPEPRQWLTLVGCKKILVVVHTVAYGRRLLEIIALLRSDFRIQVCFTAPRHQFGRGVPEFLARLGGAVVSWEEAVRSSFDLALAAGPRGLEQLRVPLIAVPHGANFLKRVQGTPDDGVAGLRRRDLVHGGRLPAAVVLAHRADLAELRRSCPEAGPRAEIVGDPVHDRMVVSLPQRGAYRRALGLARDQKLVVAASTWGPHASFAGFGALLPRLARELPAPRYRVAALLHPNIYAAHGTYQVRAWLARCEQMGVRLVPPDADWRSVLIAADWIIGDHGSVTVYGTLTGAPIVLTASPEHEIAPLSPAAALSVAAPTLSTMYGVAEQLEYAAAQYRPGDYAAIAARITSCPGGFASRMRRLIYRAIGLGQPAHPPATAPLPLPPHLDRPYADGWEVTA